MDKKLWRGPGIIWIVRGLSLFYWVYLGLNTRMVISCDALGYEDFGKLIQQHGFIPAYFEHGPNREPIYPLLVASSMYFAQISGIAYTKIMAAYGVFILILTQILTHTIQRLLNIRAGICALALAYMAISPALNNSAFSLYSEIAAAPFIPGIVLVSHQLWQAIAKNNAKAATGWGGFLGVLLAGAALIKAVFELISPAYLLIFIGSACYADRKRPIRTQACVAGLLAALALFYIPITGYKYLNQKYNDHFVITDRGPWALYGNTTRRQEPLTLKRFLAGLAYAAGEGLCAEIFTAQECDFWSFRKSDDLGYTKISQLRNQYSTDKEVTRQLIRLSTEQALKNPTQYALLTGTEGLKMFFWESTQIGFVSYPVWLEQIYKNKRGKNCLRLVVALLTSAALIFVWAQCLRRGAPAPLLAAGLLMFLFIFFYSFFFILTRYALPVVPLHVIIIAYTANFLYNKYHGYYHQNFST